MLRMSTRRATGSGVGAMVAVSVGKGVCVAAGGSVAVNVAVGRCVDVARGTKVAVGGETVGGTVEPQALSNSVAMVSR